MVQANENELLEHLAVGVLVHDARGEEEFRTSRVEGLLGGTMLSDPNRLARRLSSLAQQCRESGTPASEFFESTADAGDGVRLWASALSEGRTLFTVEPMEPSEKVNERVRQFVAHVTHDLRTPLTSLLGASDLLLSGRLGQPDEKHVRLLRIVNEGTQRMAALLNEITARFVNEQVEGAKQ